MFSYFLEDIKVEIQPQGCKSQGCKSVGIILFYFFTIKKLIKRKYLSRFNILVCVSFLLIFRLFYI